MKRRSIAQVLADKPYPEAKALYAIDRIDAINAQIVRMLDLAGPEARAIVFAHNPRASWLWHLNDVKKT